MSLGFIVGVLRERRALRSHERWSRAMLESHQAAALNELRTWAGERSRFYRRFHAGLASRPLADLPVLTKGQLMESFDELTTDPNVHLGEPHGVDDCHWILCARARVGGHHREPRAPDPHRRGQLSDTLASIGSRRDERRQRFRPGAPFRRHFPA